VNQPELQVYADDDLGEVGTTTIAVLVVAGAEDITADDRRLETADEEGRRTIAVEVATTTHPTSWQL